MSDTIVIFGASGDLTSRKLIPLFTNFFSRGVYRGREDCEFQEHVLP